MKLIPDWLKFTFRRNVTVGGKKLAKGVKDNYSGPTERLTPNELVSLHIELSQRDCTNPKSPQIEDGKFDAIRKDVDNIVRMMRPNGASQEKCGQMHDAITMTLLQHGVSTEDYWADVWRRAKPKFSCINYNDGKGSG